MMRTLPDLHAFSISLNATVAAASTLTAAVARQLDTPKPADEPLDAVAFQLAKVERLRDQAEQLVSFAAGQSGAALVAREALRRRLRALGAAAQCLQAEAETLTRVAK